MHSVTLEERGLEWAIYWFDQLESTQKRLVSDIKAKKIVPPALYATTLQTDGIGSRGNRWMGFEGNLFFSLAIKRSLLPKDMPLASTSIYFSFLLKEVLSVRGSKVWLKWPNDFYIEDKKIGGCITQLVDEILISGIGINLLQAPEGFTKLDIEVDPKEIIKSYVQKISCRISWKEIFSKYKIEFQKSRSMWTHLGDRKIPLESAILAEDGAIIIDGERVYSLR